MRSIRGRLTTFLLVGTGVLIAVASWLLNAAIIGRMELEFDRSLLARAEALAALSEAEHGRLALSLVVQTMPEFATGPRPEYFQFWLADGSVLERSPSLGRSNLPRHSLPSVSPRFGELELPDGRAGRWVEISFGSDLGGEGGVARRPDLTTTLVVARSREGLDHLVRNLTVILVATTLSLMAAVWLIVWWALRTGLEPVRQIGRQVEALDERSLSARIELPGPPRELAPVVGELNALLDRLQEAFERERRFSSAVAHELRTPLAELRSLAEVGAGWPDDRHMVLGFFDDVRSVSLQMERIVVNLLALARADGGVESVEMDEFPLGEVIERQRRRLAGEASSRRLCFAVAVPPDLVLCSDADKLELILSNLLANAVAYSPEDSSIRLEAERCGTTVRLSVANPAGALCREDLPYLFDRFWRKDSARSDSDHAGLGLSLVQVLSELLGLSVTTEIDDEGIFRLILEGDLAIPGEPAAFV